MGFHRLVNTAQFSYTARDWKKNKGRYCLAPEGSRDYTQFWEEEEKRCLYGYKIGDTWIPGRHYGYLNFFPISRVPQAVMMQALKEGRDSRGRLSIRTAEKIIEFPAFWEIDYEWWNLKHIAWYGGTFMGVYSEGGLHMCCLKSRGAGFSYKEAWDGIYNYNFIDGSKSYYFAATEPYLIGDAILDKVASGLDFINANCPYWKKNRQENNTLMHQKASFIDSFGAPQGTFSEIIGQIVDKPKKAHPYSANIVTPTGIKKWESIQKGDSIFGSDGAVIHVQNTYELGEQDIYTVNFNDGRKVQCTIDHLWNIQYWVTDWKTKKSGLKEETLELNEIINRLQAPVSKLNKLKVQLNQAIEYPYQPVPVEAYTLGLMLGDGSIGNNSKNLSYLTMMHEDVEQIKEFIPYKIEKENWGTNIRNKIHLYNGKELFKGLNLFDKRSGTKFIPDVYKFNSKKTRLAVINGLLDTDGSVTADFGVIEYCTKSKTLATDFMWVVHSLGYGGSIKKRTIGGTIYYRCYIYCKPNDKQLFNLPRKKKQILNKKWNKKALNKSSFVQIDSVEFSHREKAKCIEVDAEDCLYLIEDYIVTHNTRGKRGRKATFEEAGAFPNLEPALEICLGSMRESGVYVGQVSVFGTGGETGPDIQGLENVYSNPKAWDMLQIPNIFEPNMYDTMVGYFVPCYRANAWRMDAEGNVDVNGGIWDEKEERAKKEGTGKPKDVDRRKAEYCMTPSEALQRLTGNGFNLDMINKQIARIESSKAIQGFIRHGKLIPSEGTNGLNGVEFFPQRKAIARPIEEFPHTDLDSLDGCVSIIQQPFTDQLGKVPYNMYLITFDSFYKEDSQDTTSLFSIKVWKQENRYDMSYIDLPVAWFAGRPKRLSTVYEILFGLCRMFNCQAQGEISGGGQGVVNYAREHKLLHWLYNEPEMIHNKELASKSAGVSYLMNLATDRKKLGITYLEEWHMEPRGVKEDGTMIYNIQQIYDIAFLRELKKYNPENKKGNYDRISDAIIAMYMLKERRAKGAATIQSNSSFFHDNHVLFGGNEERGTVGTGYEYTGEFVTAY